MIETVVWIAMLVGIQGLMYWHALAQVEELQHRVKQYEDEIKRLQLTIESVAVNANSEKRIFMDDSHAGAMRAMLKKDPGKE